MQQKAISFVISIKEKPKRMKTSRMNKTSLFALLIGCGAWLSCATGVTTGQTVKEVRNVSSFDGMSLAMAANVYLTQGDHQSVEVEADKNALEFIRTEIDGNTLTIKTKEGHWRNLGQVNIYVTMQDIKRLSVSGSGSITAQNPIHSDNLKTDVSGSGNVKIQALESASISLTITGSGNIYLSGKNEQAELNETITGSGSCKTDELVVGNASITITGSGSARVNVLKELETNITGSGNVMYKGSPMVNARSTGSGKTTTL
jgi:hypothetical protein